MKGYDKGTQKRKKRRVMKLALNEGKREDHTKVEKQETYPSMDSQSS